MKFNEDKLEQAIIELLEQETFSHVSGTDILCDGRAAQVMTHKQF